MSTPAGFLPVTGGDGARAFAAPAAEGWVREALAAHGTLHGHAARSAAATLRGRAPAHRVDTPGGRWVVRRYRRGGAVAAPLLGERYLRLGEPRPEREARASGEARRRGVPTPPVVAGAVYPAGPFYRADLVTEYVPDSVDLARFLFHEDHPESARVGVLREAGRLVATAAGAGILHADLNAMNVLIERGPGRLWLLDLDRARALPQGEPADPTPMTARLRRSLDKLAGETGRPLAREAVAALEEGASA